MNKHSPAPWNYRPCRCGHPNCNQYTISTQGSVGFDEPDARLIVAAPEMLQALRNIYSMADCSGDAAIMREASEAIIKATGEKA